jgi:hypothetical protein
MQPQVRLAISIGAETSLQRQQLRLQHGENGRQAMLVVEDLGLLGGGPGHGLELMKLRPVRDLSTDVKTNSF